MGTVRGFAQALAHWSARRFPHGMARPDRNYLDVRRMLLAELLPPVPIQDGIPRDANHVLFMVVTLDIITLMIGIAGGPPPKIFVYF